jgi:hypothetical protein
LILVRISKHLPYPDASVATTSATGRRAKYVVGQRNREKKKKKNALRVPKPWVVPLPFTY